MMLRTPIYTPLALTLALLSPGAPPQEPADPVAPPAPPNIVLIVVDDPGLSDFGLDPPKGFEIPNMASIAAEGVRFTRAYTCASICGPARAGILTGRYPQRFGFEYNVPRWAEVPRGLRSSETTLGEALQDCGYRTSAVGKWHLGMGEQYDPLGSGFDEFWGFLFGSRRYFKLEEHRWNSVNRILDGRDPVHERNWYLTDEFGREATEFIDRNAENPFFLYLAFSALHLPPQAPDKALDQVPDFEDETRRKLAAMTWSLDQAVGRVLGALEERGIEDRTLVILLGDNGGSGENSADNGVLQGHKGEFFEGGLRVPLFARWPGTIEPGQVHTGVVSVLDVFPTILAAAGGTPESLRFPLDGVDLLPILADEEKNLSAHEMLCWRRGAEWAVRLGDWKLVHPEEQRAMLFDLGEDPGEQRDIAAAHPDRVGELSRAWSEWGSEMKRPLWGRFRKEEEDE